MEAFRDPEQVKRGLEWAAGRIAGLSLTASPQKLTIAWGEVVLTAEAALDQADKPRSGLPVVFEAPQGWTTRFQGSNHAITDSSGRATVSVDIPKPKGPWKDSDSISFKARVSGAGDVQGTASAVVLTPPMPMITGLTFAADSEALAFDAPVSLIAVLSFNESVTDRAGIPVRFSADPARYARFDEAVGAGVFIPPTAAG